MRYKVIQDFKNDYVELFPKYNFTLGKYQTRIELLLNFPHITKIDILELLEVSALCYYCDFYLYGNKFESDELFWEIPTPDNINIPNPTYISEYIHIIGQLFLTGYIDFLCDWDDDCERTDYPTNLS